MEEKKKYKASLNNSDSEKKRAPFARIFFVSTEGIDLDKTLETYGRFISQARRKKISRYARVNDKKRSLCAELALCFALRSFKLPYSPPKYSYNDLGKPLLDENKLHINISHSGSLAICAASNVPIGVDVLENDALTVGNILRRIIAPGEAIPKNKYELLALWTKKESYVKLIGSGLRTPMSAFSVVGDKVVTRTGGEGAVISFSEIAGYFVSLASYEKIAVEHYFVGATDLPKLFKS